MGCCQIQDHELGQYLPCPLLIKIGLILECSSIRIFHALYSCIVIFTKLSRNFSYMENMLFSFSFSEASGSQLLLAASHIFRSCTKSHIFVSWNMHKKQWCIGIIQWWVMWVSTLLPLQGPLQIASGRFLSQFLQISLFKQISCWTTKGKEIQI